MKLKSKYKHFHKINFLWKCYLQDALHLVLVFLYQSYRYIADLIYHLGCLWRVRSKYIYIVLISSGSMLCNMCDVLLHRYVESTVWSEVNRSNVMVTTFYHYIDVIISAMASQITDVSIVCSNFWLGADQRKHQSSMSLVFVRGIHQLPVNSLPKGLVARIMFPFDDVIMAQRIHIGNCYLTSHHLNHCWSIVNWIPSNKLQWNRIKNAI